MATPIDNDTDGTLEDSLEVLSNHISERLGSPVELIVARRIAKGYGPKLRIQMVSRTTGTTQTVEGDYTQNQLEAALTIACRLFALQL
jgi:hypothetical protein